MKNRLVLKLLLIMNLFTMVAAIGAYLMSDEANESALHANWAARAAERAAEFTKKTAESAETACLQEAEHRGFHDEAPTPPNS